MHTREQVFSSAGNPDTVKAAEKTRRAERANIKTVMLGGG
jgi:hypothetical protein